MPGAHREVGNLNAYGPAIADCEVCQHAITVHKTDDGRTVTCTNCHSAYDVELREILSYSDGKPRGSSYKPVLTIRRRGKAP